MAASSCLRTSSCNHKRNHLQRVQDSQRITSAPQCVVGTSENSLFHCIYIFPRAITHDSHRHHDPERFWPERFAGDHTTVSHLYVNLGVLLIPNPARLYKVPIPPMSLNEITSLLVLDVAFVSAKMQILHPKPSHITLLL